MRDRGIDRFRRGCETRTQAYQAMQAPPPCGGGDRTRRGFIGRLRRRWCTPACASWTRRAERSPCCCARGGGAGAGVQRGALQHSGAAHGHGGLAAGRGAPTEQEPLPQDPSPRLQELLDTPGAPLFQLVDRAALVELLQARTETPWYGQLMRGPQILAYLVQVEPFFSKPRQKSDKG